VLREDLGGTYGVGVDGDFNRRPQSYAQTDIRFTCAPDNVDKLMAAVQREVRQAKQQGFAEDYLTKIKLAQRRAREEAVRTNGFWLARLAEHTRFGTDPRNVLEEPKLIEALTGEGLKAAARRYFEDDRRMLGILRPAAAAAAAPAAKAATAN
jgi:zinc protease